MQTAKRILKKAAAENKYQFEGLLKYRNAPFQDIGVSPVQLLDSFYFVSFLRIFKVKV